jgi:2'-5' RNA ligase
MRLFVALELPAEARAALAGWAAAAAPEAMRRVPAESLHVTLAFLGGRTAADADAVSALLGRVARPVGELAAGDALWLPPRRPGVLAVALRAGPALAELHQDLTAALAAAIGFEPERRALRPHVTVARAQREARLRPAPLQPPPPALSFEPDALVLYRSHTGPGGARSEPLARAPGG